MTGGVRGIDPDFWRGRRVFVTGHTGFKGAWLALWLHRLGAEVTGYALPPATEPSLFAVAGVQALLHRHVEGDVRDAAALTTALRDSRAEVVLHLAAQALVRPSYDDPAATWATNVMGTVNLCQAVRDVGGVRAVLVVTSDKCYANQEWDWAYRESDALGGHDPYSASKAGAELVAASFRDSFFPPSQHAQHGVALATARAGNVIGGGDWSTDRLLPDLLRADEAGRAAPIRRPHATRPWQHVLDALGGYLLLAQTLCTDGPAAASAWNFGPDESDVRPVADVARTLAGPLGLALDVAATPSGPHEAGALRLDSAKARRHLGWRPRWTLDEALARVLQWHQAWRRQDDMRRVCEQQIDEHTPTEKKEKP